MALPNWRDIIGPGEAFVTVPKLVERPSQAVYVEVACPHCGVKQQATNRCVKCKAMIVWRIEELIQSQIQRAYNLTGRNAKAAAKLLGIPQTTFYRRLKAYKASAFAEPIV